MEQILMMQLILNNFFSLEDKVRASVEKYIEREINIFGGVAFSDANIMAMPILNVALSADFQMLLICHN